MPLSNRSGVFSFHTITLFDYATYNPKGTIRLATEAAFSTNSEFITNSGGPINNTVDAQLGNLDCEFSVTLTEYPPNFLKEAAGLTVTTTAAEASGSVSEFANKSGTSVFDATTGIATATVKSGSEADLKTGVYIVKAASATTVDVYADTSLRFKQGTDIDFEDDSLKILASALTITTSGVTEVTGTGVELTGGSGIIGMTAGDIAIYVVREINTASTVVECPNEICPQLIKVHLYGEQCDTGEIRMMEITKAKLMPFDFSLSRKEFSETELTFKCFADQTSGNTWKERIISV